MKKVLHSGEFLDHDGNTIRVTFYEEKHLWVSLSSITSPFTGGDYEVEVWSDAGEAEIYGSPIDWLTISFIGSYRNKEGHNVYKYKFSITGRPQFGTSQTVYVNAGVQIEDVGQFEGYDDKTLTKTITITRQ